MPAPFHRPKGMLYHLFALLPDLGAGLDALRHLLKQMLVHPARDPPPPCMACALGRERTGATRRGRIVAHVAPQLDGVETKAEYLPGWTAIRVRGRRLCDIVCAEEPQLLA